MPLCAGDGDVDVVVQTSSTVEWLENVGGAVLFSQIAHVIAINVRSSSPGSLDLSDFNLDGRLDVLVCVESSREQWMVCVAVSRAVWIVWLCGVCCTGIDDELGTAYRDDCCLSEPGVPRRVCVWIGCSRRVNDNVRCECSGCDRR